MSEPFRTEYWMVISRWTETIEEPALASIENPNPLGRRISRRVEVNQCIDVHPAIHVVRCIQESTQSQAAQVKKSDFVVAWATPLSKAQYDFLMTPAPAVTEVGNIMDKIKHEEENKEVGRIIVGG